MKTLLNIYFKSYVDIFCCSIDWTNLTAARQTRVAQLIFVVILIDIIIQCGFAVSLYWYIQLESKYKT